MVKKSDGSLYKVPLASPERFSKVALDQPLIGGDGLLLVSSDSLVVIANRTPHASPNAAFLLSSKDDWASAKRVAHQPLGAAYPTTAVLRGSEIFVVSSRLDQLIRASPQERASLRAQPSIQRIGRVTGAR